MYTPDNGLASTTALQQPVQRVRGTLDYGPPLDGRLRSLEARLRAGLEAWGYQGIQTPILEPLELFLRKSGEEILARMYQFSHWNRRLCLRPELTASVMRAFTGELRGASLPVRLHYGGPAFRYERPSRGRYRQFTQVGAELIGAAGPAADAEVLYLACAGLEAVGVTRYRLVVGHLGVVLQVLRQLGMSEHVQAWLLDHMESLARGRTTPEDVVERIVGLLGGASEEPLADPLVDTLAQLPPEQATAVAESILRRASLPLQGGARRPQQIIQRLIAKAKRPDPTEQVRAAVSFVVELGQRRASIGSLADLHQFLAQRGLSTEPLDEVQQALTLLGAHGPLSADVQIEVDLSLARGLRYYTGLVFEVYVDTDDGPLQLCGGGRYDDLLRALGNREALPACGFSWGLERLDLVRPVAPAGARREVLVAAVAQDDVVDALGLANALRHLPNVVVQQDVRLRGPKSALRHADRTGVPLVVLVGAAERAEGVVLLRDMRSREETRLAPDDVPAAVERLLP